MPKRHEVTVATTIAAPLDTVWGLLSSLHRYGEWVESTLEILRADADLRVGSTIEERSRICGFFTAQVTWRVIELEERRRIAFSGEGVRAVSDLGFELEVATSGIATECSLGLSYLPRFGAVGSVVELLASPNVNAEQRRSIKTLAIVAEREAGGGA